jgi:phage anti-repressor protein
MEMKEQIKHAAEQNGQSINKFITSCLHQKIYGTQDGGPIVKFAGFSFHHTESLHVEKTVSCRRLHKDLGITMHYKYWFIRMLNKGFKEEKEYNRVLVDKPSGRKMVDHMLTVDMAKEICMIIGTPIAVDYKWQINMEIDNFETEWEIMRMEQDKRSANYTPIFVDKQSN